MAEYHRKQELKFTLTEEGYHAVRELLTREGSEATYVGVRFQTNRYFDDGNELKKRDSTLRLRREFFLPEEALSIVTLCAPVYHAEPSDVILTLKTARGAQDRDGFRDHDEYSLTCRRDETELVWSACSMMMPFEYVAQLELPPKIHFFMEGLTFIAYGGCSTERHEFVQEAELVCLDKTLFHADVDFELEVTSPSLEGAYNHWSRFLTAKGVVWEMSLRGKAGRARMLSA